MDEASNLDRDPGMPLEADDVSLQDLLDVLVDNRWIIVSFAIAGLLIGSLKALTATPIYRADGLLQVEERRSQLHDLGLSNPFGRDTSVNAEIEIIRSRSVLGEVVDTVGLDVVVVPVLSPIIGEILMRRRPLSEQPLIDLQKFTVAPGDIGREFRLVSEGNGVYSVYDENGDDLGRGIVGSESILETPEGPIEAWVSELQSEKGQVFLIRKRARTAAVQSLRNSLEIIDKGEGSGILALMIEGPDPRKAYQTIDAVADSYVRENVERKSLEAKSTLDFLENQLPDVRLRMQNAESALNQFRLEKGSVDLSLETQGVLQNIVSLEGEQSELRRERESVLQAFTVAHPTVIALDNQIARIAERLAELNAEVRDLPNTQQEILRLMREVEVSTALYTSLLNTTQELQVVKAGTVGNVRVIDYAVMPDSPVKPNRMMLVFFALAAGLVAGVIAAFVRNLLQSGVEDPDRVERRIKVPVYATIAHSKRQDEIQRERSDGKPAVKVLAIDSPDDVAIESLRNLQTALYFGTMEAKNNCIMITGPSPGVGKSFVSVNLAAVLTGNNRKVLLVDGDLRRGHLHKFLGVDRGVGLSDVIGRRAQIDDALHRSIIGNLSFLSAGQRPPNPTELLLHDRFSQSLAHLSPQYDHVIIDAPPILAATDASIIGQFAGATLMVVKAGETPLREIDEGAKRLDRTGVNLRGILMNHMKHNKRYGMGKYSYQYAYSNDQ